MNQTKIDTLSKAQTRKMTPYAREEKRCVTIQTTTNRHGKTQPFLSRFGNTLTLTDHLFSAQMGVYTLLFLLIQFRHPI